jgi:predicted SnoaL-like aldol condensation-catalyzing enzyme
MNFRNLLLVGFVGASAVAQQPAPVQANPAPGCSVTPAQLEANKKAVLAFFTTRGADRVALADPSYKQHNPVFVKRAAENKVSDYEEFKSSFLRQPGGGEGQGPRQGPAGRPMPQMGNPFEVVTAECDIVTVVHKMTMQDPAEDGKPYEFFTFDTFRVKDGKLTEHWDGSILPMARRAQ